MSAARILAAYRAAFVALILAASVRTLLAQHEGGHNIVMLAAAEIVGAAALLWRRTQLPGACLTIFIVALSRALKVEALRHRERASG